MASPAPQGGGVWGARCLTPRGHSMSPKMFRMQVARYSCRSAVMPSKFLHARMSTSRGWPSSHSEISVSVSCAGDRRPGGRGPPCLPQGPPSRAPGPGSGPNKPRQGLGLSSRDTAARVAAGSLPPLWRAARVCAWACVCMRGHACALRQAPRVQTWGPGAAGALPLPAGAVQSDVPGTAAPDPKALQGAGH